MTATPTPLRELPAKWRALIADMDNRRLTDIGFGRLEQLEECADELEAALSARDEAGADGWGPSYQQPWQAQANATPPASGEAAPNMQKCAGCGSEWPDYLFKDGKCIKCRKTTPPASGEAGQTIQRLGAYGEMALAVTPPAASGEADPYVTVANLDAMHGRWLALATEKRIGDQLDGDFDILREASALIRRLAAVAPAGMDGWQATAHELLQRLQTAQPPNVLLHQLQILGDMAALLRCMFPTPPATAGQE